MTDKSELKLAPGSRWGGNNVVTDDGDEIVCNVDTLEVTQADVWTMCHVTDALAVIRAAGLDPEFERLHRLLRHLQCHGYSSEEIERIASGNDIESDQCCPIALNEQCRIDELREKVKELEAENEALLDRCTTTEANEAAALTERDLLLSNPNHWRDEAWRLQTENAELRARLEDPSGR